jgi:hypothetical protein
MPNLYRKKVIFFCNFINIYAMLILNVNQKYKPPRKGRFIKLTGRMVEIYGKLNRTSNAVLGRREMLKRLFFTCIFLTLLCTACSTKNEIVVEKQSYVRWHEKDNNLEVYAVVANMAKKDVSFKASIVILNSNVKEAVGFEIKELETDDRNGKTPFRLAPSHETVFKRGFKTDKKLKQEMLSDGIGIKITTSEESFTIPIKYGDIE